jgi:hypothetical protein
MAMNPEHWPDERILRLARRPSGFKVSRSSKDADLRDRCAALAKLGALIGRPYGGGVVWFATQ